MILSVFRVCLYFAIAMNLFKAYADTSVCPIIDLGHNSAYETTLFVTLYDSYSVMWLNFGKNFQKLIFKIRIESLLNWYTKKLTIYKNEIFPLIENTTWQKMTVRATRHYVDWGPDTLMLKIYLNRRYYRLYTNEWSLPSEIDAIYGYVGGGLRATVDCKPVEPPSDKLHSTKSPKRARTEPVIRTLYPTKNPIYSRTEPVVSTSPSTKIPGRTPTELVIVSNQSVSEKEPVTLIIILCTFAFFALLGLVLISVGAFLYWRKQQASMKQF